MVLSLNPVRTWELWTARLSWFLPDTVRNVLINYAGSSTLCTEQVFRFLSSYKTETMPIFTKKNYLSNGTCLKLACIILKGKFIVVKLQVGVTVDRR